MSKTIPQLASDFRDALQKNGHLPKIKRGQPILTIALLQAAVDFANVANTVKQAVELIDAPKADAPECADHESESVPEPRPGSEAADLVAAARALRSDVSVINT